MTGLRMLTVAAAGLAVATYAFQKDGLWGLLAVALGCVAVHSYVELEKR